MNTIVGGLFGLQAEKDVGAEAPPFLGPRHLLLVNARSAFVLLARELEPPRVWLPSYLCKTIVQALPGATIHFYPVDARLQIASNVWISEVQAGDLVVFIDYFGFAADSLAIGGVKQRGAWVLEDASQALLSRVTNPLSDFVVYSPRKFLGVPDGGILLFQSGRSFAYEPLLEPPAAWWLQAWRASLLRREFDRHGGARHWYDLYRAIEDATPYEPVRMSQLSAWLLQHHFNYAEIARRRIANYQRLLDGLGEYALFPSLPEGVVPLGFPICIAQRAGVQQQLFAHNIYPPIHWEIAGVVPRTYGESHHLASQILTLVCDQRYGKEEMVRTIYLVRQAIRSSQSFTAGGAAAI